MKKISISLLSLLALILLTACSKSQTDVNQVIMLMDQYTQSVSTATSMEEVIELDTQFSGNIQKFADSQATLTDDDRNAIMEAVNSLSEAVNTKSGELMGVPPLADSVMEARRAQFAQAVQQCTTVGQVVTMGL